MATTTDRLWRFKVIRCRPLRSETIEIQAPDSYTAVKRLPDDLVSWDFHQYDDGTYSRPTPPAPPPPGIVQAETSANTPWPLRWLFGRPADEEAA